MQIQFRSILTIAVRASMQPESGQIICAGLTLCVWFGSVLPKKAQIILCKTGPDPIQMALSGFGQMDLSRSEPACKNHQAQFWQNTTAHYQFPTFRLGWVLTQTAWIILCKTSLDLIGFWLTVSGFGKTDPAWRQASVQGLSGQLLANASEPIWIRHESDLACLLGRAVGFKLIF